MRGLNMSTQLENETQELLGKLFRILQELLLQECVRLE